MNKLLITGISLGMIVIFIIGGFFFLNREDKSLDEGILKQKTYSGEISNLILSLNDLPSDYQIAERSPRTVLDVSEQGLNRGWSEGYYIRYLKGNEENIFDLSRIEIFISRYPLENISLTIEGIPLEWEGYTSGALPNPNLGEKSFATKLTETEWGFAEYVIEFYKKDIYVRIDNGGSITDYEFLKELAKKIEKKI